MNAIVEQILGQVPKKDPVLEGFKAVHDKAANQAKLWLLHKDKLGPVLEAFEHLGAHISVDAESCLHVTVAGDKACFISCWKLWRSCEIRLSPALPGATQITEFIYPFGIYTFFYFTSTVCKRVKVGTRMVMVPQDIYETQCGDNLSEIKQEALEDNSVELLPPPSPSDPVDDIPF